MKLSALSCDGATFLSTISRPATCTRVSAPDWISLSAEKLVAGAIGRRSIRSMRSAAAKSVMVALP